MVRLATLLVFLLPLLAGCSEEPAAKCGFELKPDTSDPRGSVIVPDETLDEHDEFARMLDRPDRSQGVGMPILCSEGIEVMRELEAVGAVMNFQGEVARDTIIQLEMRYSLLLAPDVAD